MNSTPQPTPPEEIPPALIHDEGSDLDQLKAYIFEDCFGDGIEWLQDLEENPEKAPDEDTDEIPALDD